MGAAIRVPRITSKNLIRCDFGKQRQVSPLLPLASPEPVVPHTCSVIFCEAVAIYGVIVAIILQTKIEHSDPDGNGMYNKYAMLSGYAIFGSGVTCGFANLVCG